MTIKDAMKKFVVGKGGTTSLKSTTDLYDEINQEMGELINPLMALVVDTEGVTSEIQEGIHVYRQSVEGILLYTDGMTSYSEDKDLQEGYFLTLHAEVPDETGVTIKASVNNDEVTPDANGIFVVRIPSKHEVLTVEASKTGEETYTRTFDLSRLFRVKNS